jgi:hypothetical protein
VLGRRIEPVLGDDLAHRAVLHTAGGKPEGGGEAWVTVHPSFLLRVRDDREAEYAKFVDDLRRIGKRAKELA